VNSIWAIRTEQLAKRFGKEDAVRSLDLNVLRGGITGFLGRNGAGKSTTVKMLLGITHPTSGTGVVIGYRIDDRRESVEMRKRIAYVPEDKQTYGYLTVAEMVRFTRAFYADWRTDVERSLLDEYALPPNRKVRALSKGMRTKLALLLALARRPDLLILDEPSEGLDPVSIEALLQRLVATAADGTTVFFSSHQIAEVERIADRVCILDRGALVMDTSLDHLRGQYRRVTMGFAKQPTAQIDIPGIERVRTAERQIEMLVSANVDAIVERARQAGAVSIDVAPVGLREVFLETVQDGLVSRS
jgi:ABC-2 type transport system ATP-binding protein